MKSLLREIVYGVLENWKLPPIQKESPGGMSISWAGRAIPAVPAAGRLRQEDQNPRPAWAM